MSTITTRPSVRTVFAIAAMLATLAACTGSASVAPDPTDPREILVRSLQSTAALRTVHVAVIAETGQPNGASKNTSEVRGDIDFVNRELAFSATTNLGDAGPKTDIVIADHLTYNRWDGGAWSVSGVPGRDPLADIPTMTEIAESIAVAVRDPATTVALLEPVDGCGQAGCHRVQATIPRTVVWRALQSLLDGVAGAEPNAVPPAFIPDVVIDAWVEKGTLRLMQGTNSATISGTHVDLSFVLSRHDEPLTIVAPSVAATPVGPTPATSAAPSNEAP
jgi:hypothetical protein